MGSAAAGAAFKDTWTLSDLDVAWMGLIADEQPATAHLLKTAGMTHGKGMQSYLTMMAVRLTEMHRVLKPTGSIYLHCDPTASHYLKLTMDSIFGAGNFRNEISWHRSNPKNLHTVNFPNNRDIILRYSKGDETTFHKAFTAHDPAYVEKAYRYAEPDGRRYRLLPLPNPNKDRPNLTYEFLGVTRVWSQQEGLCNGCKGDFPFKLFDVDHRVPRSRGGTDHLDNLQLLCSSCNRIKGDRPHGVPDGKAGGDWSMIYSREQLKGALYGGGNKITMSLELWAPVATIALLIVTIGTYVWKKLEKFDDRLRNVEIEVAKLDERTRQEGFTVGERNIIIWNLVREE